MSKKIEEFFNKLAESWDGRENHTEDERIKLLNKLCIHQNDKVIDIACGTGIISGLLFDITKTDVVGVDLSENMIKVAIDKYKDNPKIKFLQKDLLTDEINQKFDYAVIYNAYPHFLDPSTLAKRLSEILNVGGRFAVIHSLGVDELNHHHEYLPDGVARDILSSKEEALNFSKYFNITIAEDDIHSITIEGIKK